MRRLTTPLALLALTLCSRTLTGCGSDAAPEIMYEDLDAGSDICTNSQVTCSADTRLAYQVCTTEDNATCYLRREGVRYDCAECGTIGGCFEATEELVVDQCP